MPKQCEFILAEVCGAGVIFTMYSHAVKLQTGQAIKKPSQSNRIELGVLGVALHALNL